MELTDENMYWQKHIMLYGSELRRCCWAS